jgi:hypothetical protein
MPTAILSPQRSNLLVLLASASDEAERFPLQIPEQPQDHWDRLVLLADAMQTFQKMTEQAPHMAQIAVMFFVMPPAGRPGRLAPLAEWVAAVKAFGFAPPQTA